MSTGLEQDFVLKDGDRIMFDCLAPDGMRGFYTWGPEPLTN
jgi:hypothetical protein